MFVICVKAIIYLLSYNLHECIFKSENQGTTLENIEHIDFSCVLPPNTNFLSNEESGFFEAKKVVTFDCYCYS